MKKYNANWGKGRVYRLFHNDKELGLLRYKGWFYTNGEMEIGYKKLALKSEGFWKTKVSVLENDRELMSYGMDWKGMVIYWGDKIYHLRSKGVFSRKYILTEKGSNVPLLTVKSVSKWWVNNFEIESSEAFEVLPVKNIFLLTTVSALYYYFMMMASAAA